MADLNSVRYSAIITYDPDGTAYSDPSRRLRVPIMDKPASEGPYDWTGNPAKPAVPVPTATETVAASVSPPTIAAATREQAATPEPAPTVTGPAQATASPSPDEIQASAAGGDQAALNSPDTLASKALGETPRAAQPAGSPARNTRGLRNIRFQSNRAYGFGV